MIMRRNREINLKVSDCEIWREKERKLTLALRFCFIFVFVKMGVKMGVDGLWSFIF